MIHDSKIALSGRFDPTDRGHKYFKMLNEIKGVIGCVKSVQNFRSTPGRHPGPSWRGVGGISPPPAGGQAPLPSRHPQQQFSKVNRGGGGV